MKRTLIALSLIGLSSSAGVAFAASDLGNTPAGSVFNAGLEWVYASPCGGTPDASCGGGNAGVLLHSGFHFASAGEWLSWGSLAPFQAAMASVACSSPQFSLSFDHCDYGDLAGGYVWGSPLTSPGQAANAFSETFLVRGDVHAIPEPETYAMLLAGLGLLGFVARRRKLKLAA